MHFTTQKLEAHPENLIHLKKEDKKGRLNSVFIEQKRQKPKKPRAGADADAQYLSELKYVYL